MDLLMLVPRQQGLSFELKLGLQNQDEINIGFLEFWSYLFPFEEDDQTIRQILDGLVLGNCRLAIHLQRGRVIKRVLEHRDGKEWRTVSTQLLRYKLPFLKSNISYVSNDDALRS